jgi:hypothetical protein
MTPGTRKTMLLACLHGAAHTLTYEHSPKWGGNAGRALQDARADLSRAAKMLAEVTPTINPPPILRSEVEGVALNLALMAANALHPDRPTPTDEALMGVVATLNRALAEIAKEAT